MAEPAVLTSTDPRGVATLWINRPDVNNAYNRDMIDAMIDGVGALQDDASVRVVVIRGKGRHFQAGADLNWLSEVRTGDEAANIEASQRTIDAVRFLDACPKPTVALIHGGCFGGGTGIAAACDIVIASDDAMFSIAEVRWGIVAGIIIPQLAAAMGPRNVRRYALTGERFGAETARDLGLVHEVCPAGGLDAAAAPVVDALLRNGPTAISETKRILFDHAGLTVDDARAAELAADHGRRRMCEEADEGLASFREKRDASWYPGPIEA
ncbi:MAG: enoyl-CoA hydratase-related protein [Magnetovibrio sp.]|nr:enoyl-CoA hydratase-related protein [Magnetovibrio sp.]